MNTELDKYFTEYSSDKITVEKLSEKAGINFYTLHGAFLHYWKQQIANLCSHTEHELSTKCWCDPKIVHVESNKVVKESE